MRFVFVALVAVVCSFPFPDGLQAAPPSETLLPATTKGFFAVPNVDALRQAWDATDVGRLASDPVMQPFLEDLRGQLRQKFSLAGQELGLTWEDVQGVYAGELAGAIVQPKGDRAQHAFLLLVDVTGRRDPAQALVDKISANLRQQGATMQSQTAAGVPVLVFTLPAKADRPPRQAVLALSESLLVVADHLQETIDVLGRLGGQAPATLAQLPAFRAVMDRVARESGDASPHVRWFVEPFGLAEVVRSTENQPRRRGLDYLKVLRNQGFDAIQGMGGYVQVKVQNYEFLHHSFAYVPSQGGAAELEAASFRQAARMLQFPNAELHTPEWLPRDLATALVFNWKMREAFEYSETLVNEIAGDPIFEDVIEGLRTDQFGPQLDIRRDVLAHLGTQIAVASDYRLPITPDSERLLVAIELTNPNAVAAAINRAMARDPDVRKVQFGEHILWEILDPAEAEPAAIMLKIDGPSFGPLDVALQEEEEENKPAFPHSAITVAHGRLIWTSHIDFAKELLSPRAPGDTLLASADYQAVMAALERLGADQSSFRYFSRADEALRPTYELMQQGKMPEAKTILGRALNELFGDEEDKLLRQQEIDAQQLPDYQVVRRHLGPGGVFVRTEQNGWLAVGVGLSKRAE